MVALCDKFGGWLGGMKKEIAVIAAGIVLFTAGELWLLAGETHDRVIVPEKRITFIAPMANTGYWAYMAGGIQERAEEYGIHVKCIGFSELDAEKQAYAIENAVLSDVDGIITAPDELTPEFRKAVMDAEKAGIPVVFVDSNAEDLPCICYVGSDNLEAGKRAGEALAAACGGEAEIAVITSFNRSTNQSKRVEGFEEALQEYPGMKIAETLEGESNVVILNEKISRLLEEQPEITAFFCAEGYGSKRMCLLSETYKEQYQNFHIVTFDSIGVTTEAVKQGIAETTILQNPRGMGIRAVDVLYQRFEGGIEMAEDQYIDVMVVDKENVQDVSVIEQEDIPWQVY